MPSTAEQIRSIILKHKGGASKQQIARELKMGLEYIDLICRELERKGEFAFSKGLYFWITPGHKPPKRRPRVLRRQRKPSSNVHRESDLLAIPKMNKELIKVLRGVGYKTIESLAGAPLTRFMQETKLELREAAGLINQAKKRLNKIGE